MSEEVRYWFEQAIGVPVGSRLEFLEACCHNNAVRSEVLSLLEYDTGDASPPDAIRRLAGSIVGSDAVPVQRVGAFELGRLLGSGGMGFVYEAHRVDGEVRQRVAVKFAQVSPAASEKSRESAHRRFARERQVLASLRHPYIAGLIDAGATEDGSPYAVIEQVDGQPIDSYCDTTLLDKADRIRLIVKLCDAVQFAHRNLIVHGDIKPDNVLITGDGIPKLIDFGVASDLSGDAAVSTMRAFTPGYASPEQCRGLPATVATDVYGLGAVLYRLLTGASPRELKTTSRGQGMPNRWDEDVVRPSAIRPELKGDIENILLKALQREPHRRYGSVPEFADDLNRFLARRPVRASPDSALYRASRFVRRHWIPMTAIVTAITALAVITAVSVRQKHDARKRALETRRLAERLLFEVHDEIGGVLGGTQARDKLGAIAVQYLESLARDYRRDPELAWELLNAYSRLAQSRGGAASSVGDTKSGSDFAAKTLALGTLVESAAPGTGRLDDLFAIYDGLVPVFLEAGRTAEPREAIDRMLRMAPRLHPIREAQALKQLARYVEKEGSAKRASEAWAQSLAVLRTVSRAANKPADTDAQLVSALVGYGRAQALAGDFSGAVASLTEAIQISQSRTAFEPQMARSARQLYWSHIALGDVFGTPVRFSLGRPAEAAEQYRMAQKIAERLVKADPANEMATLDLSRAFSREGMALASTQPARALALLERSHRLAMQTSGSNHSGLDSRFAYLTSSVEPLVRLGRLEQARSHLSEARILIREMRQHGVAVDERSLLKADAIYLHADGRSRAALAKAREQLRMMPNETRPILSENHATVEVLERIRIYGADVNPGACVSASERLVRIWQDLRATYPQSGFVRRQLERAQTVSSKGCSGHSGSNRPSPARYALQLDSL
jgi:eukaryotic-like serine/threonine-protein kinase